MKFSKKLDVQKTNISETNLLGSKQNIFSMIDPYRRFIFDENTTFVNFSAVLLHQIMFSLPKGVNKFFDYSDREFHHSSLITHES